MAKLFFEMAKWIVDDSGKIVGGVLDFVFLGGAMPICVHLALGFFISAALVLFSFGLGMESMDKVKVVSLDLSEERAEDWALAGRVEIDKSIGEHAKAKNGSAFYKGERL